MTSGPNVSITYDGCGASGPWGSVNTSDYRLWDQNMKTVGYRGNPTMVTTAAGTTTYTYAVAGQRTGSNANGLLSSATLGAAQNYAAPTLLSVGGTSNFDQTIQYNNAFVPVAVQGPNSASSSTSYDALGRPVSATSVFGAVTTYSYAGSTTNPAVDTVTINGRWTKTTMDGLGRPVKVETGHDSTTLSVAETEYDSCGCSPTGKVKRTALPHAAGESPVWTTYTYDALGHLTGVHMPRPSGTQTRSFHYSGAQLTSTVLPVNGTTTYVYNSDQTLQAKLDAKGQKVEYSYDAWKRVTQVRKYVGDGQGGYTERTCERVDYSYDTNPYDASYTQNAIGRLAAVRYWGGWNTITGTCDITFIEMYSYNSGGAATKTRLRVNGEDFDSTYAYNNEGQMTALQYPKQWSGSAWVAGPNRTLEYDAMARPKKLINAATSEDIISDATYNSLGQTT
jgi:YD repeat-containing protein